jgi:hypothetical protein
MLFAGYPQVTLVGEPLSQSLADSYGEKESRITRTQTQSHTRPPRLGRHD